MDVDEMRARVAGASVARLATIGPDGAPAIVPCVFAIESHALSGDTMYSPVDHKPKTTTELARVRNLERDARATLLVDHYDDDWQRLWWVRIRGRARILRGEISGAPTGGERERALDRLADKYAQYRTRRPDGPLLAIDVDAWQGWSAVD